MIEGRAKYVALASIFIALDFGPERFVPDRPLNWLIPLGFAVVALLKQRAEWPALNRRRAIVIIGSAMMIIASRRLKKTITASEMKTLLVY